MMDVRRQASMWRIGAAALGLLLSAALPARAASVRTADGAVLTVDEVGGRTRSGAVAHKSRALVFSLEDAAGRRSGFVTPTLDAAVDESPVLALDPRSGRPILIWSRSDGASMKLAWTRFDGGTWSEARALTFGSGDDRAPAVGTSTAGSTLFWRTDEGLVLHAPIDLEGGRLFAVPSALPIDASSAGNPGSRGGASAHRFTPQGGTDAPITIPTPPRDPPPHTNGGSDAPINLGRDGGTDAPVNLPAPPPGDGAKGAGTSPSGGSGSVSSQSLAVFSDPACASQILLVGSSRGRTLLAVELSGTGRVSAVGRVTVPPGAAAADVLASAGQVFLEASCR